MSGSAQSTRMGGGGDEPRSLTHAARRRWWALVLFSAAVLGFTALNASDPDSASAGLGDLIGGAASKVAGAVGGGVMKEVLEFLLGDLKAVISLEVIKWLVHIDLNVGPSLAKVAGPMVVIGGFFLVVGLITSIGDSYREVAAGTDTAARVIGQAIFRVIGLALLLGSWFWLVPLAVEVANGMSSYVLDDEATNTALAKSFRAEALLKLNPLFALVMALGLVFTTLALVVMKFVIVIMFAVLYLGGPPLIGFAALPRVGNAPLSMAVRGTLTLMAIPLAWTVVFAAWAGITAGITEGAKGADSVVRVLTGPALYLAGMVVLFGVTKKLLSMASFGTPLSVPGGRMLRTAASMAMLKGIGAAMGAAGGAGGAGKGAMTAGEEAANKSMQRHPGDAQHRAELAGHQASGQAGGAGQAQPQPSRRPLEVPTSPAENRRKAQEAAAVARRHDGDVVGVRNGQFEGLRRPLSDDERASAQRMGERAQELRQVWGGEVPSQALADSRESMPVALRSALADRARSAQESYSDPAARARAFEDRTLEHAAFRGLEREHGEGVAAAVAAGPEKTWEAYAMDYRSFPGRESDPQGQDGGAFVGADGQRYDSGLFSGWDAPAQAPPRGPEAPRAGGRR